jgi:hypothetical protein
MDFNQIINILVYMGIPICIFILAREYVCWYFKINERLKQGNNPSLQLEQVIEELKIINSNLELLKNNK